MTRKRKPAPPAPTLAERLVGGGTWRRVDRRRVRVRAALASGPVDCEGAVVAELDRRHCPSHRHSVVVEIDRGGRPHQFVCFYDECEVIP